MLFICQQAFWGDLSSWSLSDVGSFWGLNTGQLGLTEDDIWWEWETKEEAPDAIRDHDPVVNEVLGTAGKGKPLSFSLPLSVPQVLEDLVSRSCDCFLRLFSGTNDTQDMLEDWVHSPPPTPRFRIPTPCIAFFHVPDPCKPQRSSHTHVWRHCSAKCWGAGGKLLMGGFEGKHSPLLALPLCA